MEVDVGNTRIKEYIKEDAKESEKIYNNKRLCNKKRNRQNSQARKEDLELSMENTSSSDADFTGLAIRTPTRSTKGIQVFGSGKQSWGRTWSRSLRNKRIETLCRRRKCPSTRNKRSMCIQRCSCGH